MTSAGKAQRGTVELGGKPVDYTIRCSASATRRRIRVTPNGIEVVIPRRSELGNAAIFLLQNERWVLEQMDFVQRSAGLISRRPQPMSFLLRGEERVIRIVEELTNRRYGIVAEKGDEVIVRVPMGKGTLANRALELWLRRLARTEFHAALDRRSRQMRLKFGRVYIMSQRTRWGGCSGRRNLSFNWRLIMAPPEVLDYIAVHELAHLIEPKHTARFWLTVRCSCAQYERCKRWLRENEWRMRLAISTCAEEAHVS